MHSQGAHFIPRDTLNISYDSEKIAFVIQARMDSSRFPEKVLTDFCGKPMLKFQIDLLKKTDLGIDIVVATTKNRTDDKIERLCTNNRVQCVRGNEENVFGRYCVAAEQLGLEHIIRLTGDNPLSCLDVINVCLETHLRTDPDLTSTRKVMQDYSVKRYVPKGLSVDVLNCKTLLSIDQSSLSDFEKQHVIPVFFRRDYNVSLIDDYFLDLPAMSVDTLKDYERVSKYAENLIMRGQLLRTLGYQI